MFYGGPREALMHAVYRQNYGFTDLVIGRKHADAPYEDGTPIWGDFDAQEIFDAAARRAARCGRARSASPPSTRRSAASDLTDDHPDEKPVTRVAARRCASSSAAASARTRASCARRSRTS